MIEPEPFTKFGTFESLHEHFGKKLDDVQGHTESNYGAIHTYLVEELHMIGEVTDDGMSEADFIMDRTVGDSIPIGIVAEVLAHGTIPAVQRALARVAADYSVILDLGEADVVISKHGDIGIYSEDGNAAEIIKAIQ